MDDLTPLIKLYGEKNVENAAIFITQQCDPKGLAVSIPPTKDRVESILDAIHGEFLDGYLARWGFGDG